MGFKPPPKQRGFRIFIIHIGSQGHFCRVEPQGSCFRFGGPISFCASFVASWLSRGKANQETLKRPERWPTEKPVTSLGFSRGSEKVSMGIEPPGHGGSFAKKQGLWLLVGLIFNNQPPVSACSTEKCLCLGARALRPSQRGIHTPCLKGAQRETDGRHLPEKAAMTSRSDPLGDIPSADMFVTVFPRAFTQ